MAFAVPIFNEGFAVPIFSEGIGRTNYTPIYTTLHQTVKTTGLNCLSETRQNGRFDVFE